MYSKALLKLAIISLSILGIAASSMAQYPQTTTSPKEEEDEEQGDSGFFLNLGGGFSFPAGDFRDVYGSGVAASLGCGYHCKQFDIAFDYVFSHYEDDLEFDDLFDLEIILLDVFGEIKLYPLGMTNSDYWIEPYFGVGIGASTLDIKNSEFGKIVGGHTEISYMIFSGANFKFSKSAFLWSEIGYVTYEPDLGDLSFNENVELNHTPLRAGIGILF